MRFAKWTFRKLPCRLAIGVVCALLFSAPVASAGYRENFESPETSWQFAAADAAYRVQQHRRLQEQAHWGHGCEQLRLAAGLGTYVYFGHEIGRARVIDELVTSVWVKTDQPGVQLLARVVFPRTIDPKSERPVTALLQGSTYRNAGAWERLTLAQTPELVAEQARVLRLQLGQNVDVREAYLDLVILNTYCGTGVVDLLIDDLEIEGYLAVKKESTWRAPQADSQVAPAQYQSSDPIEANEQPTGEQPTIELRGAVMLVNGQPFFPRIIEHRGESFEFLKRIGFNAVRVATPPTPWQATEARRNDMWIVGPPPDVRAGRSIGPAHDRVLAWDLGNNLGDRQLGSARDLAFAVRRADEQSGRPLLAEADEQLRSYSRIANVMLLRREPLGTSFDLAEYGNWFAARRQLLRPGTPAWATIQTQPPAMLQQQLDMVDWGTTTGAPPPKNVDPQQLRLLTLSAVAAGARGLSFASRDRLDGDDEASLQRAQALELINRELEMIEPWLAVASHVSQLAVSQPDLRAAMFASQQSQLILLTQIAKDSQYVIAPPTVDQLSLVVPGVPESSDAYLLTPTGLKPLPHRRVTGGIGVAVEDLRWASAVLFTSDPLVYARVAQTAARNRNRIAQLQLAATTRLLAETKPVMVARAGRAGVNGDLATRLTLIDANLQQAQRMLGSGDANAASIYGERASVSLAQIRRDAWDDSGSPDFQHLMPTEQLFSLKALSSRSGSGGFMGMPRPVEQSGNMEDLRRMTQDGWRHFRRDQHGIESQVELSTAGPYTGNYSLRMQATGGGEQAAASIESPPVWIQSPQVPIRAGQSYSIWGEIRVDAALAGTQDGVLIHDTVQGKQLAIAVRQTEGWQTFHVFGTAMRNQTLALNIELTGLGEAFIDDVKIEVDDDTPPQNQEPPAPATATRLRNLIRLPQ